MIEYILEDQIYIDTEGLSHKGKKIYARVGDTNIGYTGYVEWNRDQYKYNSFNTSRLMVPSETFEIYVDRPFRRKGVGRCLFEKLLEELKKDGFTQLIILGATQEAKDFYDNILQDLLKNKEIESFYSQRRLLSHIPDFIYDIRFY